MLLVIVIPDGGFCARSSSGYGSERIKLVAFRKIAFGAGQYAPFTQVFLKLTLAYLVLFLSSPQL